MCRGVADQAVRAVAAIVAPELAILPIRAGALGFARVAVDATVAAADRVVDVVAETVFHACGVVTHDDADAPGAALAAVRPAVETADRIVDRRARTVIEALALGVDPDPRAFGETRVRVRDAILSANWSFGVRTVARFRARPVVGDPRAIAECLGLSANIGDSILSADQLFAIAVDVADRSAGQRVRMANEVAGAVWSLPTLPVVALALVAHVVSRAACLALVGVGPPEGRADRGPDIGAGARNLARAFVVDVRVEAGRFTRIVVGDTIGADWVIHVRAVARGAFAFERNVDQSTLGLAGVRVGSAVGRADRFPDGFALAAGADAHVFHEDARAVRLAAVDVGFAVGAAHRVPHVRAPAVFAAFPSVRGTDSTALRKAKVEVGRAVGPADRIFQFRAVAVVADAGFGNHLRTLRLASIGVGDAVFATNRLPEVGTLALALARSVADPNALGFTRVAVGLAVVAADGLPNPRAGARARAGFVGHPVAVGDARVRVLDAVVAADRVPDVGALALFNARTFVIDLDPGAIGFACVGVLHAVFAADRSLDRGALADLWALPLGPFGEPFALCRAWVAVGDAIGADRAPDRATLAGLFAERSVVRGAHSGTASEALVVIPLPVNSAGRIVLGGAFAIRGIARADRLDGDSSGAGRARVGVGEPIGSTDRQIAVAEVFGHIRIAAGQSGREQYRDRQRESRDGKGSHF